MNTEILADEIRLKTSMTDYGVPEHLQGGLVRYIMSGLKPGSFLCSVLANDLFIAMCRADDEITRDQLRGLCRWLVTEAPPDCRGSHKAVAEWIAHKAKEFGVRP